MTAPEPLPPDVAAERFAEDPSSIRMTLPEICRAFGVPFGVLVADLQAGRLIASGTPSATHPLGYDDIAVDGDELVQWMARTGRSPIARVTN